MRYRSFMAPEDVARMCASLGLNEQKLLWRCGIVQGEIKSGGQTALMATIVRHAIEGSSARIVRDVLDNKEVGIVQLIRILSLLGASDPEMEWAIDKKATAAMENRP